MVAQKPLAVNIVTMCQNVNESGPGWRCPLGRSLPPRWLRHPDRAGNGAWSSRAKNPSLRLRAEPRPDDVGLGAMGSERALDTRTSRELCPAASAAQWRK